MIASSSITSTVDFGSFGPGLRPSVEARFFHLTPVFGLIPCRVERALRLSWLCCTARRTAAIVVALPVKSLSDSASFRPSENNAP